MQGLAHVVTEVEMNCCSPAEGPRKAWCDSPESRGLRIEGMDGLRPDLSLKGPEPGVMSEGRRRQMSQLKQRESEPTLPLLFCSIWVPWGWG